LTLDEKIVNDFNNLSLESFVNISGSRGVGYQGIDFIPEYNMLAMGVYHDRKSDLVLYDMNTRTVKVRANEIHKDGITYVRWIPKYHSIITTSYDKLIKIFKYDHPNSKLWHMSTIRGHS